MAEQTLNDKTAPKGLTTQVIMSSTNSTYNKFVTRRRQLSLCGHFHCEQQMLCTVHNTRKHLKLDYSHLI